jgi:hypothetical protein
MGTLQFTLPDGLNGRACDELRHGFISGGQDNMPFLTDVQLQPGQLRLKRKEDESGSAALPWVVEKWGTLLTTTGTLIERPAPYPLVLELARGKINQVRNQASDWLLGGLNAADELTVAIRNATRSLGKAIACSPSAESARFAQSAMAQAHDAADLLLELFVQQVFQVRHQRQSRLDTALGCRLGASVPSEAASAALRATFNNVCLSLTWAAVQPREGDFQWEAYDQLLDWALSQGFLVSGGPVIDFSSTSVPSWLQRRTMSLASIASFACTYAATLVKRYRGRIRTWLLTAGANANSLLGLGEEEMLWLALRVAEAARQIDPGIEVLLGLVQPFGDYLARQARRHSPFVFADTLIRSGLNPAALDLEIVMGVSGRGSYCRDLLEASRLMDLYGFLGVPLQITLGFPSGSDDDRASPELAVNAGSWRDGFTPAMQAEWAASFAGLAMCKPNVRSVQWVHWSDVEPHLFPACGLVDARGQVKSAVERLRLLRAAHLR